MQCFIRFILGLKLRRTYDSLIPDTSVRKEIKKNEKILKVL